MQDLDGSAGKENLPRWLPTLAMDREVLGSIIAHNKLFQREMCGTTLIQSSRTRAGICCFLNCSEVKLNACGLKKTIVTFFEA